MDPGTPPSPPSPPILSSLSPLHLQLSLRPHRDSLLRSSPVSLPLSPLTPSLTRPPPTPPPHSRRSSIVRQETVSQLDDLPRLKEVPVQQRQKMFIQKLELCETQFVFLSEAAESEDDVNRRGKELKRNTLLEMVDYVNNAAGQKIFTEEVMPKGKRGTREREGEGEGER